jgi:hypothetical protein
MPCTDRSSTRDMHRLVVSAVARLHAARQRLGQLCGSLATCLMVSMSMMWPSSITMLLLFVSSNVSVCERECLNVFVILLSDKESAKQHTFADSL